MIAPAARRGVDPDLDADGGRGLGTLRHPPQMHAGFTRRAPTFLAIARHAGRDDVLPVLAATLRDRHDVVERQLARRKLVAAVLALVVVPRVDVAPRERH